MLLVRSVNEVSPWMFSRGFLLFSKIYSAGIELSLCSSLRAGQRMKYFSMLSVSTPCHLYGVKIGVRSFAEVSCLVPPPLPFFSRSLQCRMLTQKRKSCRVFRTSFVSHLSTINDWHVACHFPLLFVAVMSEIMKMTVMRDGFCGRCLCGY